MKNISIINTSLFCDYPWSLNFIKKLIKEKKFKIIIIFSSKKNPPTIIEKNKDYFKKNNIKLFISNNNKEIIDKIKFYNVQIGISIAYSKIFKKNIIQLFNNYFFNIHPSYLPQRKGPDPIRNGIIKRDKYFGVTLHIINEKIDGGDIISQYKFINDKKSNVEEILNKLSSKYFNIIIKDIIKYVLHFKTSKKQQKKTNQSYSKKLKKSELIINHNDTSISALNKIRASLPYKYIFYRKKNSLLLSDKYFSITKKNNYSMYNLKNKKIYIKVINEKK